ncbi:ribbon-helix-helix domain-containing protein [Halocatena pleomorpha]|uniref:Ribbon-helix-helix protein, CopG family n=1 Tax=Halocatena pleomorpha TaxID=1785090 RepID=A0A3P3R9X8_9EURY|nr:ribbon-helix-helix domain-containing protein [Halocatena pleomorpha]RRJ30266.1 ribbon-helix-helix protein, CopG family [Halocatena pleomorpha]
MSTDADRSTNEMEKINVRVPKALLAQIDEAWEKRGYTSKSEFIRDALRDAVTPSVTLSEEALGHLAESREQRERGDTMSHDELLDQLDSDD